MALLHRSGLPVMHIETPLDFEGDFLAFVYDLRGQLVGLNA